MDRPGFNSGTTVNVAIVERNRIVVANAGDCRAVLSRQGLAMDLSVDHKPEDAEEARRIRRAGGLVDSDGRICGGLNVSRAVGDWRYKNNDTLPLECQLVSPLPDVKEVALEPTDEFLMICCDGIWNSLESQEAVDFVRFRLVRGVPLKQVVEQLLDECMSPSLYASDGTGCDNETAAIILLKDIRGLEFKPRAVPRVRKRAPTQQQQHHHLQVDSSSSDADTEEEEEAVPEPRISLAQKAEAEAAAAAVAAAGVANHQPPSSAENTRSSGSEEDYKTTTAL